MVTAFSKLLRKIIETIDRYGLKKNHLRKHLKDIDIFSQQFLEGTYKSGLYIKYARRLKKHWEELWTFLHHDGVPWNNNNAEAAAKAFALYRRGVNGQIGEKGLRDYLNMLSLAQTCRYRNIPFLDFLRYKTGIWKNIPVEMLPDFLPFNQARLYIHLHKFKHRKAWREWHEAGRRPAFIPANPDEEYRDKGWIDWYDWVGY